MLIEDIFLKKELIHHYFANTIKGKKIGYKKNVKKYKTTPLNKIWSYLIYLSLIAIGDLLIFIYSGYIFINKQ